MKTFCAVPLIVQVLFLAGCCTPPDDPPPPPAASVSRLPEIFSLAVQCGSTEKLWYGPANSTVSVVLVGTGSCIPSLSVVDRNTQATTPLGIQGVAGARTPVRVRIPGDKILAGSCQGQSETDTCTFIITAVDPPLPPGTVAGQPQAIAPGPPVQDPAPGTVPAPGVPVAISCGKQATLWAGPLSYVTVRFEGTPNNCFAKVIPERTGHATAGGEEITDQRPFSRTFGPVTSLKVDCFGGQAGPPFCRFTVSEVIHLP
jgi:hypothetical protein